MQDLVTMETMKERALAIRQVNLLHLRNVFILIAVALLLAACGGGGGASSSSPPVSTNNTQPASVSTLPVSNAAPSTAAADLDLAARLYKGDARTPAGFDLESRPSNVAGTVSTRHLKNTDLASGPQAISQIYEVCTNDMAQAIDWSERQAGYQGQYSDIAEVHGDARMFEIVRVPRADVTAMIRHRVFRCDYLDRTNSDLRADAGSAGSMNQRPLTADELEKLAEYLWQFTLFNNSDYAVASSATTVDGSNIVQTIRMGQLVRGSAGSCDTVQLMDWTHTMNSTNGSLTRTLSNVRSFQVKPASDGAASCAG
jgi:hypothetical protein